MQKHPAITRQKVLIVDFGAQYAQLIARRVREAKIYSEIVPHNTPVSKIIAAKPSALILSGGPSSVYAKHAPKIDKKLLHSGIPTLGLCYGFQLMAQTLGGTVERTGAREYGRTKALLRKSTMFKNIAGQRNVWMSHSDSVVSLPNGFEATASTNDTKISAFESNRLKLYGIQWHPEVKHTENGQEMLNNFLYNAAGLKPDWNTGNIIQKTVKELKTAIGDENVICGLSGGVDSAVAAALVQKAVGKQLTCVFVNHGLLRKGEVRQVKRDFVAASSVNLYTVNVQNQFLANLKGVTDPEAKRKIIGRTFIKVFNQAANNIAKKHSVAKIKYLVQGTLYPDVVESGGGSGTASIKSHHNVGGLPKKLNFELIEPLRTLFKDEVRQIGLDLGLPKAIVYRHPFPGPGLAVRIVGKVNDKNLKIVREADAIVTEEMAKAGLMERVWQCPVVLLANIKSVGVQGDMRTYGHPIVIRPVTSEDAMTADWARLPYSVLDKVSRRITNEISMVNRVVLDISSKPPGTIEWE